MHRFVGILGIFSILGMAYLFSTNRRAIRYKTVAWGLGLQIVFAFLVMRWRYGQRIFAKLGAARTGCSISHSTVPPSSSAISGRRIPRTAFIFAFQALPTIIFIAAFFALLYYLGVMQVIVQAPRPA